MNLPAYQALMEAVRTRGAARREEAVEEWIRQWTVTAEVRARVSDPHPKVVALELAAATRHLVEAVATSASSEKVLGILQSAGDPLTYLIELNVVRCGVNPAQARLRLVPKPEGT